MVRFLRDFQSKHTSEVFYPAGATAELDSEAERALVLECAAEIVTIDSRRGQAQPKEEETHALRGRPRKAN